MDAEMIRHNLQRVQEEMASAALRAGRDPAEVRLVAVTKTFPAEVVLEGYRAGLRDFGENRPEEGEAKIPVVNAAVGHSPPIWHMVGHVQSRKAESTAANFDFVHSVDRLKVGRRLSRFAVERDRTLTVLLECNVSGEQSKYGFQLDRWQQDADQRNAFFETCAELESLPGLRVTGLMTMAPFVDDPETIRPVFANLRALRDALQESLPQIKWHELSMGMSDDFQVAIEEGASMIRLGRALFGPRVGA